MSKILNCLKLSFLAILLSIVILPNSVQASNEFSTSYNVTYNVQTNGVTQVTEKVSLKNLTSKYYASNFILTIGSTTITNVSASDDAGAMETKIENQKSKTSITVNLNQQIAGIDKTQTFTLKYDSKDFAGSLGKTWEVNLPKIPEAENITDYNLTLQVPVSFGDPTSISPTPKTESSSFDTLSYHFTKDQLITSGVSVNFGTNQLFDFNLKYQLENNSLFPVTTSIPLPPDTSYQDIQISRISPEPLNVTVDADGNYLAWYRLARRDKQEITVIGSAKLYINPRKLGQNPLTNTQTRDWTKADTYWEKDNPAIASTIAEIFKEGTPSKNRDKARLIFEFVVTRLKYDTSRLVNNNIERLGAVTTLSNPNSAVCMEFTDLFIALSRAAGVPAREVDGFAYSQNTNLRPLSLAKDLLHAWPEYYDGENGWIMIDPTWENTSGGVDYFNKFDLNHLTFAIKGVSSKTPYVSDEVKVQLSTADFLGKPQPEVTISSPETILAGFPSTFSIKVINQGNVAQQPAEMDIKLNKIVMLDKPSVKIGLIPPFGSASYDFNIRTPDPWQGFNDNIEVTLNGQKFNKKIMVKPLFNFIPIYYIFAGVAILLAGVYGTTLALHFYQKKFRRTKAKK